MNETLTSVLGVTAVVFCWVLIVSLYRDRNREKRRRIAVEAILQAAPATRDAELCKWIDRYNQVVKDHTASHAAAERFLEERNQLQNALDRIEYAATTAQPVSDDELMKALESERAVFQPGEYTGG